MADNSGNPKLEWMYKTGQDMINRDEYLTGRKVDKHFEEITTGENCVEHDVLPASVSRKKSALENHEQVDIIRKQMEDPLMAIKQKEMEARRKILENPVKLKELHRLLKEEKSEDKSSSKKSSKKKSKKSRSSSSSSSDSEDLDKLLLEKYKNIKNSSKNDSDDDTNFIEKKFKTLTKELDKMVNTKKRRSPSKDSDRHRNKRDSRRSPVRVQGRRRESPDRRYNDRRARDFKRRSRTPDKRRENRYRSKSRERKRESPRRQRSRSLRRNRRESPVPRKERKDDSKYRNPSPPKQKATSRSLARRASSSSDNSPPPQKQMYFDDSDDERRHNKPKNFGLVTASGEKIALEKKDKVKYYTREELKPVREAPKKQDTSQKKRLNSEEMDKIRAEMMKNADWREKDREKIVKRHRESEEREKMKHEKEFDKDFLNRHMKKAQDQIGSVESRIRSNLNNIQRTGRTMDANFAKR